MAKNDLIRQKKKRSRGIAGFFERIFLDQKLDNWVGYLLAGFIAIAFGYLLATQILFGISLVGLVLGLCVVIPCLLSAETGLYINLVYSFLIGFFSRSLFHDQLQIGVISDILILSTLFSYVVKRIGLGQSFNKFIHTRVAIWNLILLAYVFLEFFNPGAHSFAGWYIAFRKSLETLILLFIAYNVFDSDKKIKRYITVLFLLCSLVGMYGCIQQWHGLFGFEKSWVMEDPTRFGLIFIGGDFRKFSTMSDPTAYGILMAACSLFFIILALGEQQRSRRGIILCGVIFMLLGMSYSGTRTSNVMIVAGIGMFILLSVNKRTTRLFAVVSGVIFLFLLYAPIYGNMTINRFRTSFIGSNDQSFNVREMSRKFIQPYIWSHPIGGGLGTTGAVGVTYNPGHYLAGFQTDNGYLQLALEFGWIGLAIICILYYSVLKYGIDGYFSCTDEEVKLLYAASIVCIFSFTIAEFAQTAIGELSDEVVYYPIIALILKLKYFDKPGKEVSKG